MLRCGSPATCPRLRVLELALELCHSNLTKLAQVSWKPAFPPKARPEGRSSLRASGARSHSRPLPYIAHSRGEKKKREMIAEEPAGSLQEHCA